ncbi:MAG: Fe-S cluster assembly protein SufD [Nitrososphaerota archaeon]|jgi:Fe-S cluster assembly protein SufB/Fe-S cluster assembly protein SufD|nr:Fe-S cluster assembly protein SufD [Nitrososphaerota archaeon]MDG6942172.1 Fe-S cluster assembly protein SufD [Nitrososphaerota archaeon]MDG6942637.1 Fe-S cluster assembly protein SufD [Nitrososphaerota archaeon]MDG6948424.1 Fe-S cluster assembly protein SufD [Nitrososphaerota archaeon]MDG6950350.1 Fe-S cluster assembly protein SufD [Nitrososphaerota archaeon]
MSQASVSSFNEDLVRSTSESLGEPSWLRDARLDSFGHFTRLPPEKNPLYTKYAGLFGLSLEKFGVTQARSDIDFRSFFGGFLTGKESNILLQGNETQVHRELSEDLVSLGVNLMSFHDALREEETKVRKLIEARVVRSESDKFAAFVNAFFNCGTFVRVPRGVALDKPLRRMLLLDSPRTSVIEQNFVIAEEGARLVYLEEQYSKGASSPAFVAATTEILARPNSHVDFSSIQLLDDQTTHLSNKGVDVSADARATMSSLSLGASTSRSRTNFFLNGRGSFAEGFEIFFTDGKQRYDYETNLVHNSPDSTGSTQARGVLKGDSQTIFKGMIKIVNAAKNSRSYLAHHAMILERTAKSDGVPSLEIDNNEVKATHSASVAQIDEEQLFYLMARGLSPDEAKKMVVLGFFEPVLSRVPIEQTREGARFMIEGKWHGEKRRLVDREALLAATGEVTPEVKESEDIFERHYKYR